MNLTKEMDQTDRIAEKICQDALEKINDALKHQFGAQTELYHQAMVLDGIIETFMMQQLVVSQRLSVDVSAWANQMAYLCARAQDSFKEGRYSAKFIVIKDEFN